MELWGAIDYLIRTGQSQEGRSLPRQVPEEPARRRDLDRDPRQLRARARSCGWLDDPATRPFAQPLADKLMAAARRYATQPERIARFVAALTGTPEEQNYAVARLREAGPLRRAVPGRGADRAGSLARGRAHVWSATWAGWTASAVPPLLAVLDSPDAAAGGRRGDGAGPDRRSRAVPFLTYPAASALMPDPAVREAAQAAIAG